MALIRRPFDLYGLRKDFDNLFESFFGESQAGSVTENILATAADIGEDKDNYYVELELPGVKKEDISIKVKDNQLVICGEKKETKKTKDFDFYRAERIWGNYSRYFELPTTVDKEKIDAKYADGVLSLKIPKKEEAKPKELSIKIK